MNKIIIKSLGQRLKQRMEELDMKDQELADQIEVHPKSVQKWKNSNVQPGAYYAYQMSQALKCDFQWLVTGFEAGSNPAIVKELVAVYNINNKTDIKVESKEPTKFTNPIIGKILKELEKADDDDLERILRLIQLGLKIEKK